MPIDMSNYKMIYKDQVFNVVSIMLTWQLNDKNVPSVKLIDAWVINENGELAVIKDEAWCFKFIRR